jgi:hypothetical protein
MPHSKLLSLIKESPDINKEKLFYTFGWELGDTLKYEPYEYDTLWNMGIINEIDSIKLQDGFYYKITD